MEDKGNVSGRLISEPSGKAWINVYICRDCKIKWSKKLLRKYIT